MIDNGNFDFEFEDEELQFVNFIREQISKFLRGEKHYLRGVLDTVN